MAGDSLFVYYKCNGAVMNARTIITSARCCNIANGFSNIIVVGGFSSSPSSGQQHVIDEVVVHPGKLSKCNLRCLELPSPPKNHRELD